MSNFDHISQRLNLITFMKEKKFSVYTRMSFMLHVSNLKHEEGDIVVNKSIKMLESGVTEKEFLDFVQEKYKLKHVLEITKEELEQVVSGARKKGKFDHDDMSRNLL